MRNLDTINPESLRPDKMVRLFSLIPIAFSLIGITLANAAAPSIPLSENPVFLLNFLIGAVALIIAVVSIPKKWKWDTKHVGASLFHLASIGLISLTPCLCIVFYSHLPIPIRMAILLCYITAHGIWCYRFVKIYQKISKDTDAINFIYQEEDDAVYYMQKTDVYFLEKKYKFRQGPKDKYYVIFNLLSFSFLFFADVIRTITDLPFIHTFLLVNTLPISMLAAGLATRLWIIYYYYPDKITQQTSKTVYVDMGSKLNIGKASV